MPWLFYAASHSQISKTAEMLLETYVPQADFLVVTGIENLGHYFHSLHPSTSHALIIVNKRADLVALKPFKKYFRDMKCLIGWTHRSRKKGEQEAFEFHPRIIVNLPEDFEFLGEIMKKVIGPPLNPRLPIGERTAFQKSQNNGVAQFIEEVNLSRQK